MKKIIIYLGLLVAVLTATNIYSTKAAAVNILTVDQAAAKLAKAEQKAFTEKKDVKVTYSIKCSKKKLNKTTEKISNRKNLIVLGFPKRCKDMLYQYEDSGWACLGDFSTYGNTYGKWVIDNYKGCKKFKKTVNRHGIATVTFVVDSKSKALKKFYKYLKYEKKIFALLRKKTAGFSQPQKAVYVSYWLYYQMTYKDGASDKATYPDRVLKGTAKGVCADFSRLYQKYALAAGVKHVAIAGSIRAWHAQNAVRFEDGIIIMIEPQRGFDNRDYATEERALFALKWHSRTMGEPEYLWNLCWEDGKYEGATASDLLKFTYTYSTAEDAWENEVVAITGGYKSKYPW